MQHMVQGPSKATYDQVCSVQAEKKRDDNDEDNATSCNDGLSFILDILSLLLCWRLVALFCSIGIASLFLDLPSILRFLMKSKVRHVLTFSSINHRKSFWDSRRCPPLCMPKLSPQQRMCTAASGSVYG